MSMTKVVITGAAGYIAGAFLRAARQRRPDLTLVGFDRRPPAAPVAGVDYRLAEMLDPGWPEQLAAEHADHLVHLAFILDPMRDEEQMARINLDGTMATVSGALAGGTSHIVHMSSATAYGAFADNPVPLRETDPLRGDRSAFRYAKDKGLLEKALAGQQRDQPKLELAIVRPVVVYGPRVENYLSRFLFAFSVVPLIHGGETPVQFVHEDDVADLLLRIVERRSVGPFNLAGSGWLTMREVCHLAKRPTVDVPRFALALLMGAGWRLGWSRIEAPPTMIDYVVHPWVVSTERARRVLDYHPRYSSRKALEAMLASRPLPNNR
jgi:UDP-glucose 4-epimerase